MKKDIDKYKKDIFKAIYSHNEDVCWKAGQKFLDGLCR